MLESKFKGKGLLALFLFLENEMFIYNTFIDNPPVGSWVFAKIHILETGEKVEKLVQYREPSIDPRAYIDQHGEIAGRVISWRFLNIEGSKKYDK